MRIQKLFLVGVVLAMVFLFAGCNFPLSPKPLPTPFNFATPNLTMTAIFKPTLQIPPTITPAPLVTATNIPSATQLPSPTLVPPTITNTALPPTATSNPDMRSGFSAVASYVSKAPEIDGDWSDWSAKAYPAAFVVFGAKNWTGAADLEGSFKVEWDNDYLYLAAKVRDDRFVQRADGKDMYKGDSLEILLDSNVKDDFYAAYLSSDDYQLGISPGDGSDIGKNEQAYLWYPLGIVGDRPKVKIAAIPFDGGYRVEAAIPWSTFGIKPYSGAHYGFAFSVSDDDDPSAAIQQSMVSSDENRVLVDPTTWGDLTLK